MWVSVHACVHGVYKCVCTDVCAGACVSTCSMQDEHELAAIELQIREFGQTPRQLFVLPHPSKVSGREAKLVEEEVRTVGSTTEALSLMDNNSRNSLGVGHGLLTTPTFRDTKLEYMMCLRAEEKAERCEHSGENMAQPLV